MELYMCTSCITGRPCILKKEEGVMKCLCEIKDIGTPDESVFVWGCAEDKAKGMHMFETRHCWEDHPPTLKKLSEKDTLKVVALMV